MTDPKQDIPLQAVKVLPLVLEQNYPAAAIEAAKLMAMIEAELVPPIDAPALDPSDRAAVDAEIDAEVTKP